ncbi:MAG: TonB C-terminal domain-containing protein [Acidobacteriaceae bacterium]|nr:TonB C-terminal domain-containing protein [Acidobacteriaceae bacterium]
MAKGFLALSDALDLRPQADSPRMLAPSPYPLNLLLERPGRTWLQWVLIVGGSFAMQVILLAIGVTIPTLIGQRQPEPKIVEHHIPLYLPPDVLTQRAPNKGKISKQVDLADLMPRERSRARAAVPKPSKKHFEVPKQSPREAAKAAPPQILPEAPKVAVNRPPSPPAGAPGGLTAPPPPPKPEETPGPFQNLGEDTPPNPHPTLAPPRMNLRAAAEGAQQDSDSQSLNISNGSQAIPSPAAPGTLGQGSAQHSAVELKSDPEGTDFKPYLRQILAIVRANWRRVIPESARRGALKGRTVMEFVINRDGSLPKIVIAEYSGSDALDRAAAAGLTMSNPLPPLPDDFKGSQVRLAFTFDYNMPQ